MMKNKRILGLLFCYVIITIFMIIYFNGTGGNGDTIMHYLFAKYAPVHPRLYFDHWAKPLYVLLASPFAQFGFVGIKVFNATVTLFTLFFTFKIAQKLHLKNGLIGPIIILFSPLCFILTFSGLTEPLFALFTCLGIYALLSEKRILSSIIISFLPFIRSEGLIILGIFGFYFLLKKDWKSIPFLLFGHIFYSIAGYFVYHDILWVFTKIPYAHVNSLYGSGKLFHFVDQLLYIIGIPIYILFWIGVIAVLWKSIRKKLNLEVQILVFLGFFAFFIAHSLFWYLGIFNSMGLKRVLVGVSPLIAIISLIGFNFFTEEWGEKQVLLRRIIKGIVVCLILIFPFTSNPAAINWKKDLSLAKSQEIAQEIVNYIPNNHAEIPCYYYDDPYLNVVLNLDPFDKSRKRKLTKSALKNLPSRAIVIWENWFAVVQNQVPEQVLDNDKDLIKLHRINNEKDKVIYSIYQKK